MLPIQPEGRRMPRSFCLCGLSALLALASAQVAFAQGGRTAPDKSGAQPATAAATQPAGTL